MRAVWLWTPPVVWALCIFLLSSTSDPQLRPPGPDTALHIGGYGVMGFLVYRALAGGLGRPLTARLAGLAIVASAIYGGFDEIHQAFVPGRSSELRDFANDTIGSTAGTGAAVVLSQWVARRRQGSAAEGPLRIVLYTREGCHLCHDALAVLERERASQPFDLEVRDVDEDPELARRFGAEVPVVFLDGRKAFKHQIDSAALRRRLQRARPGGTTT